MKHRAHDFRFLIQRWKTLAKSVGVRLRKVACDSNGEALFYLQTRTLAETGGVYLSAGIHGDEPGATEGLIRWAETHAELLTRTPLLIFPCMNPWGLQHNQRTDERGLDLNRSFHRDDVPVISAIKTIVGRRQFRAAFLLHEDYDGQGFYLYEIGAHPPHWGERLLEAAARKIVIEERRRIDGRKAVAGLMRPRIDLRRMAKLGFPEAAWLRQGHAARSFTLESPSEFSLEIRASAHAAVLDAGLKLALATP